MDTGNADRSWIARGCGAAITLLSAACASLPVQDIHPKCQDKSQPTPYYCPDTYIDYVPPPRRIITQTRASESLHLYGEPGSADADGDGIADARLGPLMELAERFSPILRKNTNRSVPWNIEDLLRLTWEDSSFTEISCDGRPTLHIDHWNVAGSHPTRQAEPLDLGPAAIGSCRGDGSQVASAAQRAETDRRLRELLARYGPGSRHGSVITPGTAAKTVLYFDWPGYGERSWARAFDSAARLLEPHVYVHLFLEPARTPKGARVSGKYSLVIQYWFFYPLNDGGNNHEGDWEHINVHVAREGGDSHYLSERDVRLILNGDRQALDGLRIGKVDYYLHHFFIDLDYLRPDTSAKPIMEWHWISDQIEYRKGRYGTHPVAYIGADNTGLDQILAWKGSTNRDSHGTYPFPGTWKRIGPLGATERIDGAHDVVPTWEELEARPDADHVTFDSASITLLPDWERLRPLFYSRDPRVREEARRRWFWLVLPIQWGFPVSESPGGNIAKGTDMGNVGPVGPAYNHGWNRSGRHRGMEEYRPYVLPDEFGMGFQDNFHGDASAMAFVWGIRDLVVPVNLFAFVRRFWDRDRKFFPRRDSASRDGRPDGAEIPFKTVSFSYRPFRSFWRGNSRVVDRLSEPDELGDDFLASRFAETRPVGRTVKIDPGNSAVGLVIGTSQGRLTTRLGLFQSTSSLRYRAVDDAGLDFGNVLAERRDWLLTGGLQHRFLFSHLSPYVFGGYGWHFWRVQDVRLEGEGSSNVSTRTFRPPLFVLPNMLHLGAGLEWFFSQRRGLWEPELGINAEIVYRWGSIKRWELGGGLTLSF